MEYVFYIDLFFLTDFFLNLLSLLLTAVFLKKPIGRVRICAAAAVGSVWNCVLVLNPLASEYLELALTILLAGSLMVLIAFWETVGALCDFPKCLFDIGRENLTLLLSSTFLGGCLSLAREQFCLTDWECLVFAGAVTGAFGIFLQNTLKSEKVGAARYLVRLYHQGECREFTALVDSGNRLRVPETGKPVTLISFADCKGFCDRISGGFYIPYRAVGTDHGLLFAITFEKMEIMKKGICTTIEKPAVAIIKESLSLDGDFNMLLPEEYVAEISDRRKSP